MNGRYRVCTRILRVLTLVVSDDLQRSNVVRCRTITDARNQSKVGHSRIFCETIYVACPSITPGADTANSAFS
jgi:hypothetical protein